MAKAPPRPGAVRSVAQLLVVIVGGTAIGALLVLLAFPDATPVGAPILLAGAGVLAVLIAIATRRLGRVRPPVRRPAAKKKPAGRKLSSKKKPANNKKPATKKKPAKKKPAQGRARR